MARNSAVRVLASTLAVLVMAPAPSVGAERARQPARDAVIGKMEIPALGVTHTIRSGMTDRQFDRGMGWWPGTALPGEEGNMVLAGHRTVRPRPLWDVQKLRAGDEIIVTRRGARHRYLVTRTRVVRNDATWILDQTENATLTMFTCHPRGSTRQRYVVTASLAP